MPETGRERQLSIALIRADELGRLGSFLESARRDALCVFESHPIRSSSTIAEPQPRKRLKSGRQASNSVRAADHYYTQV